VLKDFLIGLLLLQRLRPHENEIWSKLQHVLEPRSKPCLLIPGAIQAHNEQQRIIILEQWRIIPRNHGVSTRSSKCSHWSRGEVHPEALHSLTGAIEIHPGVLYDLTGAMEVHSWYDILSLEP
jgi:hypothetical protein